MKRIVKCLMFVAVMGLATGLAVAKSADKAANKSTNILITTATATPDGMLQPGTYKMTLFNEAGMPQVAFYKGNKLICKCPVTIENLPTKAESTQLLVESGDNGMRVLKTIAVGGWTEKVIFPEAPAPAGSGR